MRGCTLAGIAEGSLVFTRWRQCALAADTWVVELQMAIPTGSAVVRQPIHSRSVRMIEICIHIVLATHYPAVMQRVERWTYNNNNNNKIIIIIRKFITRTCSQALSMNRRHEQSLGGIDG